MTEETKATARQFKCEKCGADMDFAPGKSALKCPYCSHENHIPQCQEEVRELDFNRYLSQLDDTDDFVESETVKCAACGAQTTLDPSIVSDSCAFCGSSLVTQTSSDRLIKPKSLLPFKVTDKEAKSSFKKWILGLWFAPNALKKYARIESSVNGMYIPYWTYDTTTFTWYDGQRGEDYWETQHYTETVDGKTVHKTRQVRKTRWYPASGTVWNNFDDLLVLGSTSLPKKYADELEPWDLENLVSYQDDFLSGFRTENYHIGLEEGFVEAKERMDAPIRATVRRDIGGDHQRIHSMSVQYNNITFKHILLPVWISAYRYNQNVYRFLVNARTGEVQGERPWSWVKITLAVLAGILLILGIVIGIQHS
ncbi:hypothetical protein BVY04_04980 [bacterium M21]|nr:hypothetical protein BVY04_04980 [bacterium M21]